jgi:hypothetical protein
MLGFKIQYMKGQYFKFKGSESLDATYFYS